MTTIKNELHWKARGEARVRLIDQRVVDAARASNPNMDVEELDEFISRACDLDTGWSSNTITDLARRSVANGTFAFGSALNIFIHEGTTPANAQIDTLQMVYTSQSPNQIRVPDSTSFDTNTLVQTRTVQFTAPSVARNIRIVGLTFQGSASTSSNFISGIAAYTVLSSTIIQSTSQLADVQYRVTFSVEL